MEPEVMYANVWLHIYSGNQFIGTPWCKTRQIALDRTVIDQGSYRRIGILHIRRKK